MATEILFSAIPIIEQESIVFTIAFDGEIGYFSTYETAEKAERIAVVWRERHSNHTYEVDQNSQLRMITEESS